MNLSGNKIVTAPALLFAINMANADAPNLVEFSAGTAAKAAEVNANFEGLKTYSAGLEGLIEAQAALITALEEKATEADAARASLEAKAAVADAERTALEGKVTTLEAQADLITALEEKATAADAARSSLEGKITTLEAESADLKSQISALDGSDSYTIAVYGDGELIGHTNTPKVSNDKQYMALKTEYGMATLRPGSNNYEMREYDYLDKEQGYHSVYYTDNGCNNPVSILEANPIGFSMLFTETKGVTDTAFIATSSDAIFLAEAGTEFSDTSLDEFFDGSNEGCTSVDYFAGKTYIPVVEMTEELHGLKSSYTTLSLEGYQTN